MASILDMTSVLPLTGTILAGGQARRMGGIDKGLVEVSGRPMIEWIIDRLAPQVDAIVINANRNHDRYARYGHPVVADNFGDYEGPLAGFAAAMEYSRSGALVTVPCDSPAPPRDLAQRLLSALQRDGADLAVAHDGDRLQPVYALLPVTLLGSLRAFLAAGDRKIDLWYAQHRMATADFSDCRDAFANLNRPEDALRVERMVSP